MFAINKKSRQRNFSKKRNSVFLYVVEVAELLLKGGADVHLKNNVSVDGISNREQHLIYCFAHSFSQSAVLFV